MIDLVQLVGQHDRCVGEPRLVEHLRRLDGQVGQVARIEADAHRLVAFARAAPRRP